MKRKKLKLKKQAYFVIGGLVILAALILYLILCLVTGGDNFVSNTTINGIKVGNMNKEEARKAIEQQYQNDLNPPTLTLLLDQQEYPVDLTDNLTFDSKKAVDKISKQSNSSFFRRGYNYLFNHDYTVGVKIKNKDLLNEKITNSQILNYSTLIPTNYELKGDKIIFTKGKSGKTAELESVFNTINKALNNYDFKGKIKYSPVEHKLNDEEIKLIHENLSKEAKNATLDKNNNYEIIDSQVGAKFDLEDAIAKYNKTTEGKQFTLNATIIKPEITKEMLEQNLFKDVLGEYATNVSGTSVRKNNVKLSGDKCNGVILLPGEEFSYNIYFASMPFVQLRIAKVKTSLLGPIDSTSPSITSGVRVIPPIIAARAIACACFDALPARYAILAAARRASISAITIFRLSLSLALPPMMYSTS